MTHFPLNRLPLCRFLSGLIVGVVLSALLPAPHEDLPMMMGVTPDWGFERPAAPSSSARAWGYFAAEGLRVND